MPQEIALVNPNTGTCPNLQDAPLCQQITIGIYKRALSSYGTKDPEENPWGLSFMTMLHMANDSGLFRTSPQGDVLPLYEGEDGLSLRPPVRRLTPPTAPRGPQEDHLALLPAEQKSPRRLHLSPAALLGGPQGGRHPPSPNAAGTSAGSSAGVTSPAAPTSRTLICSALPRVAVGHTYPLILSESPRIASLYANLASFTLDYVVRQKISGTHLTFGFVMQLPVLPPSAYDEDRVRSFIDHASSNSPTPHGTSSRSPATRATMAHRSAGTRSAASRCGPNSTPRSSTSTASTVTTSTTSWRRSRSSSAKTSAIRHVRTKDLILQVYDAIADATQTGKPYQTILDPPPGHGPRHPAYS